MSEGLRFKVGDRVYIYDDLNVSSPAGPKDYILRNSVGTVTGIYLNEGDTPYGVTFDNRGGEWLLREDELNQFLISRQETPKVPVENEIPDSGLFGKHLKVSPEQLTKIPLLNEEGIEEKRKRILDSLTKETDPERKRQLYEQYESVTSSLTARKWNPGDYTSLRGNPEGPKDLEEQSKIRQHIYQNAENLAHQSLEEIKVKLLGQGFSEPNVSKVLEQIGYLFKNSALKKRSESMSDWAKKLYKKQPEKNTPELPKKEFKLQLHLKATEFDPDALSALLSKQGIEIKALILEENIPVLQIGSRVSTTAGLRIAEDVIVKERDKCGVISEVILPKGSVGTVQKIENDRATVVFNQNIPVDAINYVTREKYAATYPVVEVELPLEKIVGL